MAVDFEKLEKLRADLLGSMNEQKQLLNQSKKLMDAEQASGDVQYTLFASGINNGRDVELKDKNYTNNIAIVFDVVTTHAYKRSVDKTSYATENKVKYSDHAVIEDGVFSFTAKINSSPTYLTENNYIDKDTNKEDFVSSRRPEKALEVLERLIKERRLISLVTEDNILDNYILTSLEAVRSAEDGAALTFALEFQEFRTFSLNKTAIATVYSNPKKVDKTKHQGAVQSSASDQDIEVTTRRTILRKPGSAALAEKLGIKDITSKDQVSGTLSPNGTFKDLNGKVTDYESLVGK